MPAGMPRGLPNGIGALNSAAMYRLFLLRHARAAWAGPGTRDFDRPLTSSGAAEAQALGRAMTAAGYAPDLILCSTARRARDTWENASANLGLERGRTIHSDGLYGADAAGCLAELRAAPDGAASLLLVGHNPTMEDLALGLAADGEHSAMKIVAGGFPAGGLAVIAFERPLSRIAPGEGFLEAFLAPARP